MYDYAQGAFNDLAPQMAGLQEGIQQWGQGVQDAVVPAWQQQLQGGAFAGQDYVGRLNDVMSGNVPERGPTRQQQVMDAAGNNNYADAYRQNFINDASAATDNMLSSLDSRAAASGMGGSSRHGTATAQGMKDISGGLQSNLANIGYQDYQNNLQNQLGVAGAADAAADQATSQQMQMLSGLLSQQQGAQANALTQTGDIMNLGQNDLNAALVPLNLAQQGIQSLGGPVVLSDSQSASQSSSAQGGI